MQILGEFRLIEVDLSSLKEWSEVKPAQSNTS